MIIIIIITESSHTFSKKRKTFSENETRGMPMLFIVAYSIYFCI